MSHRHLLRAAWIAPLLLIAGTAHSAAYVCSINRGLECESDGGCYAATDSEHAPSMLQVDTSKKLITILAPDSRRGEKTKIETQDNSGGLLAIAGVEAHRGWSAIIRESDGRLTATITDEQAGFVVFGDCLRPEQLSP